MVKKKILVDMDQVLNRFSEKFAELVIEKGYDYTLNTNEYDLKRGFKDIDLKERQKVKEEVMSLQALWFLSPVYDLRTISVMQKLNDKFDLWIATSPYYKNTEECKELKLKWLEINFPFIKKDKVIFSDKKWKIKADCIIDDNPTQLKNFMNCTIAMDYGYNRDVDVHYRVKSWAEIEKLLITDSILTNTIHKSGVKHSYGKLKWKLVDFRSLEPMVGVLMHGAKKYSVDNWKKVKPEEYIDSLLRHVTEYCDLLRDKPENSNEMLVDCDSHLPLIGHILCNAMFLSWFERKNML